MNWFVLYSLVFFKKFNIAILGFETKIFVDDPLHRVENIKNHGPFPTLLLTKGEVELVDARYAIRSSRDSKINELYEMKRFISGSND